jgi:hypothetical protein
MNAVARVEAPWLRSTTWIVGERIRAKGAATVFDVEAAIA